MYIATLGFCRAVKFNNYYGIIQSSVSCILHNIMLLIILKQQVNVEEQVNGNGKDNKEVDRSSNSGIGEL